MKRFPGILLFLKKNGIIPLLWAKQLQSPFWERGRLARSPSTSLRVSDLSCPFGSTGQDLVESEPQTSGSGFKRNIPTLPLSNVRGSLRSFACFGEGSAVRENLSTDWSRPRSQGLHNSLDPPVCYVEFFAF